MRTSELIGRSMERSFYRTWKRPPHLGEVRQLDVVGGPEARGRPFYPQHRSYAWLSLEAVIARSYAMCHRQARATKQKGRAHKLVLEGGRPSPSRRHRASA